MDAGEIAVAVIGALGSGGIGMAFKSWIDGKRAIGVARIEADVAIAPDLLKRIDRLEEAREADQEHIDELREKMDEAQRHVQKCERENAANKAEAEECLKRYEVLAGSYDRLTKSNAELSTRYMRLEGRVSRVERRSTPSDFPAVKEEDT